MITKKEYLKALNIIEKYNNAKINIDDEK